MALYRYRCRQIATLSQDRGMFDVSYAQLELGRF